MVADTGSDRGQPHVAVSGASGLIGTALISSLAATGYQVTRLVRRPARTGELQWDPASGLLDPARLGVVDAVVHLAGENVGVRWTAERKRRIKASRSMGTRSLSESLARATVKPKVLIAASAVGIYGNRGDEILTEGSTLGDPSRDFLAEVAQEWESATEPARQAGIRVVNLRIGIVLSPRGGALRRMLLPFHLGLGGRLGSGRQWMSWIAIDDVIGAIEHALTSETLRGPVNLTAPEPVTNRDFTAALGRALSRPAIVPVPAPLLRLALGEMAGGTVLASARVLPTRLLESGYRFQYSDLSSALRHVLRSER